MNRADTLKDIDYKINQTDCTQIGLPFHGGIN